MFEDFDASAFDDAEEESPQDVAQRKQEQHNEFWRLLVDERAQITQINGAGRLAGGVHGLGDGGSVYISARNLSAGSWQLNLEEAANWQKTYLLNYAAGRVTCVRRSVYEADHDFFVTVALSGCRFTLTETHVLHIAADAGAGQAGRDEAENAKLHEVNAVPALRRRVSVTSRHGSLLYHPAAADALAHVAQLEAIAALQNRLNDPAQIVPIALAVADVIRPLSASDTNVDKAAVRLRERLADKLIDPNAIDAICTAFGNAVKGHVVASANIIKGAFVVGVKAADAWRYYVLANGAWRDILPG